MKLINDVAIILNKKEISGSSVLVTMFTKEYGKISAIIFNARNSKKKHLASIMPLSISDVELEIKSNSKIIKNSILKKSFNKSLLKIEKLQLSLYVLHSLNQVLEFDNPEEELYNKSIEILEYINELDENTFLDVNFNIFILVTFLRRLMIELGIYDISQLINQYGLIDEYKDYITYSKNANLENTNSLITMLNCFQDYINNYFNIKLDYKKILIL
ncbi:DNA repair protein RecO [Streptobacillus moniliformis]|uniref:DNA repair protein RecO n=1 Tax=Streptobacillus moniliformis TaxID=34105 RepID=UPI0007E3B40A|nr:DNA repair protein RecO [Streptobacillus moniliformis]